MKIYLRKILPHDLTHEVSITTDIVKNFFEGLITFTMEAKKSSTKGTVTINSATDPRFGGDFKSLLKNEGDVELNDIVMILKMGKYNYKLEIIKAMDERYNYFNSLYEENNESRHIVFEIPNEIEISEEIEDITVEKLAQMLKESYNNPNYNKAVVIHLFGIRYGQTIKQKQISLSNIIKLAEISESMEHELRKGVNLSNYINVKEETNEYLSDNMEEIFIKDRIQGGSNLIYYGVPGTGKSFSIDERLNGVDEENIFRVTFHPEFTYNDFIGQLVPTVIKEGENKGDITYDFQKGVFTLALEKAYKTPSEPIYLIIEEMSRGNCAAIFGDIFQLLDRVDEGEYKDWSRYFVNNKIIAKDIDLIQDDRIKMPSNLYILGTVNTSDQNVFVMDTAFKRRFEWKYISTKPVKDKNGEYLNNADIVLDNEHTEKWIDLYGVLNKFISSSDKLGLGEDKQIGQFFIKFNEDDNKEKIQNKLLHYLWFDIKESSYKTDVKLFEDRITSFADLYDNYAEGKKIFSDEFYRCIDLWKENSL